MLGKSMRRRWLRGSTTAQVARGKKEVLGRNPVQNTDPACSADFSKNFSMLTDRETVFDSHTGNTQISAV
jgi:hypothetical protein